MKPENLLKGTAKLIGISGLIFGGFRVGQTEGQNKHLIDFKLKENCTAHIYESFAIDPKYAAETFWLPNSQDAVVLVKPQYVENDSVVSHELGHVIDGCEKGYLGEMFQYAYSDEMRLKMEEEATERGLKLIEEGKLKELRAQLKEITR